MAKLRPFRALRPADAYAASIAALPYDVYNRQDAREEVTRTPLSFLQIDRAETQFSDDIDMYSQEVYDRARDTLLKMTDKGYFVQDDSAYYYLYALTMNGRTQTGIVGCASIDDYLNGVICRHENTREDKELDRIRHVDTMNAQTGPIFLAYRSSFELKLLTASIQQGTPVVDFTAADGIRHQVWTITNEEQIAEFSRLIGQMEHLYIADGHHRAASAVKVGLKRRTEHPDYDGSEEFNYFLSVLFPDDELQILDYNRVVTGRNGYTQEALLHAVSEYFTVEQLTCSPFHPQHKGEIGMYMDGIWYRLTVKSTLSATDSVGNLDVAILQEKILEPLLGIKDPKTDSRIRFVGGIYGLNTLVQLADEVPEGIAFSMYPTSMDELLAVADAGLLMPPKSTWFEPKLRSGLFIHTF